MKRSSAALLSLLVCLGTAACGPKGGGRSDLTSRVMFTANGSYDAQADTRDRQGGGLRRVLWQTRPPLDAHTVTVVYDSDARPLGWEMQVEAPRFSAQEVAGRGAREVQTPDGDGFRPAGGQLRDVLIVKTSSGLRLLTRGYAEHHRPELAPAFGKR